MPRQKKPAARPSTDGDLPDKPYFKIGEAARLVGVAPSVLRYWEKEFKREIHPSRSSGNQRVYRREDVIAFRRIQQLRYREALPVAGTKRRLRVTGEAGRHLADRLRDEIAALLAEVDDDERGE